MQSSTFPLLLLLLVDNLTDKLHILIHNKQKIALKISPLTFPTSTEMPCKYTNLFMFQLPGSLLHIVLQWICNAIILQLQGWWLRVASTAHFASTVWEPTAGRVYVTTRMPYGSGADASPVCWPDKVVAVVHWNKLRRLAAVEAEIGQVLMEEKTVGSNPVLLRTEEKKCLASIISVL